MGLVWLDNQLKAAEAPVRERLGELSDLQHRMLRSVRSLAKSLRPALLDYQELVDALLSLLADFRQNTSISYRLASQPPGLDVPNPLKTTIYRIVQESLTNVARHAHATRCTVSLRREAQGLVLRVRDNGKGADPAALEGFSSMGIIGMKERAASVGGTVRLQNAKDGGVCVTVRFPTKSSNEVKHP
jgi:two-component system, NarL family, sensor histidine kinase UhpB